MIPSLTQSISRFEGWAARAIPAGRIPSVGARDYEARLLRLVLARPNPGNNDTLKQLIRY